MSIHQWMQHPTKLNYDTVEDVNPYSLPIIIHLEKKNTFTHETVLLAVAHAFMNLTQTVNLDENILWNERITLWLQGRIRKVTRRARGTEWDKVTNLPGAVIHTFNNVEICILPPHSVNETPSEVKKLQVAGLDLPTDKMNVEPSLHPGLNITVNPELVMTTGKTCAQIGHAVQVSIMQLNEEQLKAWEKMNFTVNLTTWDVMDSLTTVEIYDAGFTEIEAHSLTVKTFLKIAS